MAAKRNQDKPAPERPGSPAQKPPAGGFPIIGIGASAGGLEAFEQFFRRMPADSGMAFVLIPHLDPGHASLLTEILQRSTTMPVVEAQDQMAVAPNRVYVIPPNRAMTIFHGTLQLNTSDVPRGQRMLIDLFLRSLADDQGEKAIGMIFSGTGTDGTLGLRAIHGAGGLCFVQDPATAKYDGMPASVVRNDFATYVLPIDQMPDQVLACVKTLFEQKVKPVPSAKVSAMGARARIMQILRTKTGHDFSLYKSSTISRRIERRMAAHSVEDMDSYVRYLQEHPQEVQILFKEMLINVTSFFRDSEAFMALKKEVLPRLFEGKPESHIFRVWVVGCATGEEAYSIAILFREHMNETNQEFKVQIYGTDINEDSIARARAGLYPVNIAMDVSSERLKRFFIKEDVGYRIKKEVRGMMVFAVQDVAKDPPFTKMDMVSCRNLLIYLEPELQGRVIPTFHYALKPGGVLFFSPSESIGAFTDLFAPLNKKHKIFQTTSSLGSARALVSKGFVWAGHPAGRGIEEAGKPARENNVAELTKRALLKTYAPPSVVTDERGHILFVHGDTGRYLQPAPGQPSLNVIDMARAGLQLELRAAIHTAATQKTLVRCKALSVKTNGGLHSVDFTVQPFPDQEAMPEALVVSFQEIALPAPEKPAGARRTAGKDKGTGKGLGKGKGLARARRVEELEQEILYIKENLQASIEEMQASNEELKSTNEELQSTNEELQSTNEELETSKEELQSVNEELVTVNAELQAKIEQLAETQNDMKNLFESTSVGTIFLDHRLAIKRFTHEATTVYRLVASDIGRPLSDIRSSFEGVDLLEDARAVLDSFMPRERQVETTGNEWYLVRSVPYRTLDNVLDGVVLTLTNVTALKRAEEALRAARDYAEQIVETLHEPLIVLDGAGCLISANQSFYRTFSVTPEESIGRCLYELGNRQWNIPRLREALATILAQATSFEALEVSHDLPGLGRKTFRLNGRCLVGRPAGPPLILLAMNDVTGRTPGRA